jgi:hypothetical protein
VGSGRSQPLRRGKKYANPALFVDMWNAYDGKVSANYELILWVGIA